MNGGEHVAESLKREGVQFLFTLAGGHIAPILVAAKARGIRVIDVRHEANAVFAADAVARLTGIPGVAVVTAGPGVTNTLTAIKNAQLAQSSLVLLGGAAATALQGRGALQDIDQLALLKSAVKWQTSVRRVRDIAPALQDAFFHARSGTPGPVFVELPIDLLYDPALVKQWYGADRGGKTIADKIVKRYLQFHVNRLFADADTLQTPAPRPANIPAPSPNQIQRAAEKIRRAQRPLLLIGSQALLDAKNVNALADAVNRLDMPVYLSGMARGLLGKNSALQFRHKRREALREADVVILAGVPADFRLDYGNHISRRAFYISANRDARDLTRNRKPNLAAHADPAQFLMQLAAQFENGARWTEWKKTLRARDDARNQEIIAQSEQPAQTINPLYLCRQIENALPDNALLVADGGDFVATASYIVSPRAPLTWLDPGVFGTLGVGAGFALGAKLARPDAEVWLLYGDGAAGFSLMEFDTFVRHNIPVIAVVGNDAGWTQIAREQIEYLHDDVATVLNYAAYERAAEGLGAKGWRADDPELISETLENARHAAQAGSPVLVNAILGKSDFRKGSISM
ncbi:thiamine pyrophosphate-binding protein [Anaerolineae bacterium CFX7]|nr:thiamine pyrophosphate-binding protein [Anaerolineae bacterium CFX7]